MRKVELSSFDMTHEDMGATPPAEQNRDELRRTATEDVQRLFTARASFYHRLFEDFFRYGNGLRAFFRTTDWLRSGVKILDAGCGGGAVTRAMNDVALQKSLGEIVFHGFDLTPAMLHIFQRWIAKTGTKDIELQQSDVLHLDGLPRHWQDYDLIVSSAMLEYLPKAALSRALMGLKGRLKPDGVLLIFITRRNILMRWLIQAWWKADMYTREELIEAFRAAGFRGIRFARFPFPYSYQNLWGFIVEAKNRPAEVGSG